jgi:membrane-associated phospholipid phosphatase
MISWRLGRQLLVREGAPLLGLYWLYSTIRWFVARDSPFEAFENAFKIIQLEEQIGIFHEPAIQNWLAEHAMSFVQIANTFYTIGYFPIIILCAALLYRLEPDRFLIFKLAFLLSLGFALFCFSIFPLAPPRMLPEYGFVDTQQVYSDGFYNRRFVLSFYNPYAAMPSLHFGLTLLVGIMAYGFQRRTLKLFGLLYPAFMAIVIVTTGHHYFLDIVAGGVVVGLAYGMVRALPYVMKDPFSAPAGLQSLPLFGGKHLTSWIARSRLDPSDRFHSRRDREYISQQKLRATVTAWLYRWRPLQ